MAVTERGSGPPIVLAPGMSLDRRLFDPQVRALSARFRMIAYDMRARSPQGESPYDLYDLVDDLRRLLDRREIGECLLVGMSMGGFMAVRAAITIPDRLRGIVLIGSSCVPYPTADIERWHADYAKLDRPGPVGPERGRREAQLHFSRMTRRRRPGLVSTWADRIAERSGRVTWNEFLCWGYQDDVSQRFREARIPTLIVHGQEDEAVPLAMALRGFEIAPDARLLLLPYAAHAPNLEYPGTVNQAIEEFAAELGLVSDAPFDQMRDSIQEGRSPT